MQVGSIIRGQLSLTTWASVFFLVSLLLKAGAAIWLKQLSTLQDKREYSYIGYDYPETWPIERGAVLMAFSHSIRYDLDSPDGAAEWSSIVPGDGLIHLGEHKQPYSISMFHQLKCLDIMREDLVRERGQDSEGPSELTRHCLNYLKQMVMCRGDIHLEAYLHPNHRDPIDMDGVYECQDWSAVNDEAKKNQAEFKLWKEAKFGRKDDL